MKVYVSGGSTQEHLVQVCMFSNIGYPGYYSLLSFALRRIENADDRKVMELSAAILYTHGIKNGSLGNFIVYKFEFSMMKMIGASSVTFPYYWSINVRACMLLDLRKYIIPFFSWLS